MTDVFKLRNQIKHYEWGSPEWIPRLLGKANTGEQPWAELWMGSHPASPSMISSGGKEIGLGDFIAADPLARLGKETAEKYCTLPFLFKLLAAEKPLSIQAHPNLEQARTGFEGENKAGIPLDAPNRNYKDANHKPEILCALSPFKGMCGFRAPAEIRRRFEAFLLPAPASLRKGFAPLLKTLDAPDTAAALQGFLKTLFELPEDLRNSVSGYIQEAALGDAIPEWETLNSFAKLYPGDPGITAPLYLNLFSLEPGEAVFLKAGVLHAYIHGFGVELMANSDNVLRGGLTPKHVDIHELMHVLDFSPMKPEILAPGAQSAPYFRYPGACEEFSLSVIRCGEQEIAFPEKGPAICIVTQGSMEISRTGEKIKLAQGESVFITPNTGGEILRCNGNCTAYIAAKGQA